MCQFDNQPLVNHIAMITSLSLFGTSELTFKELVFDWYYILNTKYSILHQEYLEKKWKQIKQRFN
jgi:hypothetical protein